MIHDLRCHTRDLVHHHRRISSDTSWSVSDSPPDSATGSFNLLNTYAHETLTALACLCQSSYVPIFFLSLQSLRSHSPTLFLHNYSLLLNQWSLHPKCGVEASYVGSFIHLHFILTGMQFYWQCLWPEHLWSCAEIEKYASYYKGHIEVKIVCALLLFQILGPLLLVTSSTRS